MKNNCKKRYFNAPNYSFWYGKLKTINNNQNMFVRENWTHLKLFTGLKKRHQASYFLKKGDSLKELIICKYHSKTFLANDLENWKNKVSGSQFERGFQPFFMAHIPGAKLSPIPLKKFCFPSHVSIPPPFKVFQSFPHPHAEDLPSRGLSRRFWSPVDGTKKSIF